MNAKILILSSFFLLALFAIAAHAFADSTGKTADQLIAGDEIDTTPAGMSSTPMASREAQTGQKGKEILNVSMGGKLNSVGYNPTQGYNPKDTRTQDFAQTTPDQSSPAQEVPANTTPAPAQEVQVAAPAEQTAVSGSWSLELADSASRIAALTLFQSGDAVFGSGNVNIDANTTLTASASGTLTGKELKLDLLTLGKVNLYRLTLVIGGESATGNYTAYSPSASPTTGTARGTRSVPSS